MKANRKKIELAMARACMTPADVERATNMLRPTLNKVLTGKSVLPATLGTVARALGVDPADIIEAEEE